VLVGTGVQTVLFSVFDLSSNRHGSFL
jgi:hypothetical protein